MRLVYLLFIGVLTLISFQCVAQIVPPAAANQGAVFDTLAGILVAVGAGYGVFKFRKDKKS